MKRPVTVLLFWFITVVGITAMVALIINDWSKDNEPLISGGITTYESPATKKSSLPTDISYTKVIRFPGTDERFRYIYREEYGKEPTLTIKALLGTDKLGLSKWITLEVLEADRGTW